MASSTSSEPQPVWLAELQSASSNALAKSKATNLVDPPGYISSSTAVAKQKSKSGNNTAVTPRKQPSPEEMDSLKLKKAWELAIAPAKQLPMNAIGMYMTGNSLQIFSIIMVFMLFKAPIEALFRINSTFARLESEGNRQQMILVKLAFVACNMMALGLGIWKINGMGLLPTTRSDWLAWETARNPIERAYYIP